MNFPRFQPTDLLGFGRLAIDATTGLTGVVESMHHTIARTAGRGSSSPAFVYEAVRAITRLVGTGMDVAFLPFIGSLGAAGPAPEREAVLAAMNGVLGDHLAATNNPLAIPIRFRRFGQPLRLERAALAAAIPDAGRKLLVLVHGLCMNDLQWTHNGHNHGEALAAEFGWTTVHLHFNSGLHVSTNGRAFAGLLEELVAQWPVPLKTLAILGHSSGGLLARSAYHYGKEAGHAWTQRLKKLVFLGTPHHGSLLERGGNWVNVLLHLSAYSAPLARVAKIRSSGITDLRHGNLLDEDWQGGDRFHHAPGARRPVPLPEGIHAYTIAATLSRRSCNLRVGDGLVPLNSALGLHDDPALTLPFSPSHQWVGYRMNHWDLLSHPGVYSHLRKWLRH